MPSSYKTYENFGVLLLASRFEWLSPTADVLVAGSLVVICIVGWGLNLIALPGNWIAVAALAIYAAFAPGEGRIEIGMIPVVISFVVALMGEAFEFAASAMGAKSAGASRRATIYAMIGSMIGAIGGAFIGIPVPVIGSVLAAILFGGLGAMAGAMYGEWSNGKPWRDSWGIGHAAFWGRTVGTIGKMAAGLLVVIIAIASLFA